MQPNHEADDLQALLHEEYGAPRLDDQFSTDLIGRLQAEATPLSTPTRIRRSSLAIWLGAAAVASLVITVIWISNPGTPGTNHEMAHQAKTDSDPPAHPVKSLEFDRSLKDNSFDNLVDNLVADVGPLARSMPDARVLNEMIEHPEGSRVLNASEKENFSLLHRSVRGSETQNLRELLRRQPLKQNVAEAKVIIVATALKSSQAPPNRPGDIPENLITFRVTRVLKGELTDKVITTQTPTDPKEFIERAWVVMLSPEYVAGKSPYAGLYNINLEPEVDAILAGLRAELRLVPGDIRPKSQQ